MVSAWGGYVFIINLIPLHVLVLVIIGHYSNKVYVAYTTFYVLGEIMAMQVPFVGFQPVKTSEHIAAMGVFGLLQVGTAPYIPLSTHFSAYRRIEIHSKASDKTAIYRSVCGHCVVYILRRHCLYYASHLCRLGVNVLPKLFPLCRLYRAMVGTILLFVGHGLCKNTYPHHCECVGASATHMGLFLLRSSHNRRRFSRWTLVLREASE
jgi:hypothetical protein